MLRTDTASWITSTANSGGILDLAAPKPVRDIAYWLSPIGRAELRSIWSDETTDIPLILLNALERAEMEVRKASPLLPPSECADTCEVVLHGRTALRDLMRKVSELSAALEEVNRPRVKGSGLIAALLQACRERRDDCSPKAP